MKLCRFEADGRARDGVVEDRRVIARDGQGDRYDLAEVRLLAPARPRKYLAIGLNYADHVAESGLQAPEVPFFFNKQVTCVVGPGADVHMPRVSKLLDYEGELAIVIARRCRHVSVEQTPEVIAGYTIANDLSVRDWQLRTPTMTIGKSFDSHGPLGPWIVTADELGDPHNLHISLRVNGVAKQDSSTRFMVFRIPRIIKELSTGVALEAGDVVLTGTPEGVGFARKPPEFLKVGDVMEAEIEKIGVLRNTVATYGD